MSITDARLDELIDLHVKQRAMHADRNEIKAACLVDDIVFALTHYRTLRQQHAADAPCVYGVIVTSKEARSGMPGNPLVTTAGERFWVTVEPEGWVPASSCRVSSTGDSPPGDPKVFPSRERAEEFAKHWKGHPWWCIPNGEYEIVPLRARKQTDPHIVGYERA